MYIGIIIKYNKLSFKSKNGKNQKNKLIKMNAVEYK